MKGIEQVLDDNDHDVETAATAVIQTKVQDGSLIYDLVRRQYSLLYGKDIQGGVIDIAIDTVGARKWTDDLPDLMNKVRDVVACIANGGVEEVS